MPADRQEPNAATIHHLDDRRHGARQAGHDQVTPIAAARELADMANHLSERAAAAGTVDVLDLINVVRAVRDLFGTLQSQTPSGPFGVLLLGAPGGDARPR